MIDPSIFQLAGRGVKSVGDYDNEYAQAAQNKVAQALGVMRLDEARRGVEADGALSRLIASGAKPDDVATGLAQQGYGRQSLAYTKQQQELAKQRADTEKAGAETAKIKSDALNLKVKQSRDQLATVNDPQGAAAWVSAMYSDPEFAPLTKMSGRTLDQAIAAIPSDPEGFAKWKLQSSLGAEKLVEYTTPTANTVATNETSRLNNEATNATSRANNAATNATSRRGQDLVDARAREANSAGKVPAGYRLTADGKGLEFIPGGPADPIAAKRAAPTEFQGKSAMFGSRAQEADRIITDLAGQYSPAAVNAKQSAGNVPLVGGALEAGGNLLLSSAGQKAEQAQRDFINAVLRLESGAAIAKDEFDNAKKQYFPQPGDGPDVIAQKAANRKLAIQGLLNNARPGAVEAPPSGAPKVGMVEGGYRFKGGDPADPKSWEKQ